MFQLGNMINPLQHICRGFFVNYIQMAVYVTIFAKKLL